MTNDLSDSRPSWRPSTQAIGASDLPGALMLHRVVVVHFWAEWNTVPVPPSQIMNSPIPIHLLAFKDHREDS